MLSLGFVELKETLAVQVKECKLVNDIVTEETVESTLIRLDDPKISPILSVVVRKSDCKITPNKIAGQVKNERLQQI